MPLGYDIARCTGQQCPSADNCQRYTERQVPKGVMVAMAAFYVRRERRVRWSGMLGADDAGCRFVCPR